MWGRVSDRHRRATTPSVRSAGGTMTGRGEKERFGTYIGLYPRVTRDQDPTWYKYFAWAGLLQKASLASSIIRFVSAPWSLAGGPDATDLSILD